MFHQATLRIALIALVLSLAAIAKLNAQDTLFLRNGSTLIVNVDEIGLDDIKYREPDRDVRLAIDKDRVARVGMHDGHAIKLEHDALAVTYDPKVMAKKHVIKTEVLSLAFNHLTLGYEQVLKPWINMEVRAGYIGVGNAKLSDPTSGMMVSFGMKFISRPDYITHGLRLGHPLAGRYVKPEILFNTFTTTHRDESSYYDYMNNRYVTTSTTTQQHLTNLAFNVVFGKQRFLGNGITLDTWFGIGYGYQSNSAKDTDTYSSWCYNHVFMGRTLPIALSAGMSFGVAF